jgi:hypothetical protein
MSIKLSEHFCVVLKTSVITVRFCLLDCLLSYLCGGSNMQTQVSYTISNRIYKMLFEHSSMLVLVCG